MIKIDKKLVKNLLPKRKENSNKGTFGKALNIVGSNEYIGAGLLCALAALKSGAGYSILLSEEKAIEHYKNLSPDLIYKSHINFDIEKAIEIIEQIQPTSVVLGCGIGLNDKTITFTKEIIKYLKEKNINTVIDADGLNCLAKYDDIILKDNFILTPHPMELSRLLNINISEIQNNRENYIKIAQDKYKCTILLKGHDSLIIQENNIYQNTTGNSALAKAGTGDILTGMIGGFLAQGVSTCDASICACYLHGLASEIYSEQYNEYSMLASDLLDFIPEAIKEILS